MPQASRHRAALKACDNIDVEAATNAGVWLTIVRTADGATAELAIDSYSPWAGTSSQAILHQEAWLSRLARSTLWYGPGRRNGGYRRIGLVGRAIAERLVGFQCQLLAYDQSASEALTRSWPYVTMASFGIDAKSDYVVLALPLTADTRHIVNAEASRP